MTPQPSFLAFYKLPGADAAKEKKPLSPMMTWSWTWISSPKVDWIMRGTRMLLMISALPDVDHSLTVT